MNIQAVNAVTPMRACQPIKPVSFEKTEKKPLFAKEVLDSDSFAPSEPDDVLAQKYDMACLVAGYYKNKYDSLVNNGNCIA